MRNFYQIDIDRPKPVKLDGVAPNIDQLRSGLVTTLLLAFQENILTTKAGVGPLFPVQ